jgi:hypothetical protein
MLVQHSTSQLTSVHSLHRRKTSKC